jgi:hypothetical protein
VLELKDFAAELQGPHFFPAGCGHSIDMYRQMSDEMSYKDMAGHCQDIDPILRICTHKHFLTNFG